MILYRWHTWRGESGKNYRFKITLTSKAIPDTGGVYVFVRRYCVVFMRPLYVGKASNFRSRIIGHERWWEAWWDRGATEKHLIKINSAGDRSRIEEDLIRSLNPVMNRMLIKKSASDAPSNAKLKKAWYRRQWWKELWWGKRV